MSREPWKQQLEPFAEAWYRLDQTITQLVQAATDEELKALARAVTKPTTTNCGAGTYRVSHLVADEVRFEWQLREKPESQRVRRVAGTPNQNAKGTQ